MTRNPTKSRSRTRIPRTPHFNPNDPSAQIIAAKAILANIHQHGGPGGIADICSRKLLDRLHIPLPQSRIVTE